MYSVYVNVETIMVDRVLYLYLARYIEHKKNTFRYTTPPLGPPFVHGASDPREVKDSAGSPGAEPRG